MSGRTPQAALPYRAGVNAYETLIAQLRPLVKNGRDADQAWRLLKAQDDVGWVTAGKLLARKRPRLIPVWDNVVRCALGRPANAWIWLDDQLRGRGARRDVPAR